MTVTVNFKCFCCPLVTDGRHEMLLNPIRTNTVCVCVTDSSNAFRIFLPETARLDGSDGFQMDNHLLIIICASAGALIIILVVVVLLVNRHHRHRNKKLVRALSEKT